jgi:anaerobic magnesium-protoporphyrin IX monomethyl ester cyclase
MAKVAFVQNLDFEYLGVMYLSAALKKNNHQTEIFIGSDVHKLAKEIKDYNPDLVGFSCTTGIHSWCLKVAQEIKKTIPAKIIFGGPHPTFFPEIIGHDAVDIICRGEGEGAILDIAKSIDEGRDYAQTLNCWFSVDGKIIKNDVRPLIQNLDELPFPDRNIYEDKYPYLKSSQKIIIAGRGCPFDCSYCFNKALRGIYKQKGVYVRKRSVDNILKEIELLTNKEKIRSIYFQDDTFFFSKDWLKEFSLKYKEKFNFPYLCLLRIENIDEETAKLLSSSHCKNVFFGIESGSEGLRFKILKRNISDVQIIEAARLLKKYKIRFRTYNMLGLPGETVDDAFKTVEINARIGTDYPWCSLLYPFPGTEICSIAHEQNLIPPGMENEVHISFFKSSVIKSKYQNELANLQKLFFFAVKFPKLNGAIRILIKMRPNFIFSLLFLISYAWCYFGSENLTFGEVINKGLRNVSKFYFKSD